MKKILKDIEERQLEIVALICETADTKIIVLGYDNNEKVSFISNKIDKIKLYEAPENTGGLIPLCDVGKAALPANEEKK